jgi:Trk K+ transport system NAD-binding subunit
MATGVTVISGVEKIANNAEVVGLTVGEVRTQFGDILNITEGATALVNGESVSDDVILEEGDELVFSRILGSKG